MTLSIISPGQIHVFMWCSAWGLLHMDVILPIKACLWNGEWTVLRYKCNVFLYRTMWTWESWCSHCAISPRLAGSPSPWSKPEISKPWTSLELQVGADWMQRFHKEVVQSIIHMKSVSCFVVGFCFVASRADTLLHPNWPCYMLSFSRSVCESVSDVWRPKAKEEEDVNQA